DDPRRAGFVFHEHAPPEASSQLFRIETRHHVGQTAGRIGHDDSDWLRWIGLRRRLRCDDDEPKCAHHGPTEAPHVVFLRRRSRTALSLAGGLYERLMPVHKAEPIARCAIAAPYVVVG